MKKTILTITLSMTFFFTSTFILSSCGNSETKEEVQEHIDHSDMETDEMAEANYACPMHPEETGIEGNKCSICNMKLEKIAMSE